jgi:hypothetical protein
MSGSRKIIIAVAVLALLALPIANVMASHYFDDVPTSAFYHNSVTALANADITSGCSSTNYCPNSAVTRGQMAVFLDRVANLRGEHDPVVDALSVLGQATIFGPETFAIPAAAGLTECMESTKSVPPDSVFPYVITAQLTNAPVETSTVNVSVDDPDLEDQVFDVCFTLIGAGTDLPVGDYDVALGLSLNLGSGIFASASAASRDSAIELLKNWKN